MTEFCNHSCLHCYNHWRVDPSKTKLTEDNYEQIYEKVTEELISQKVFAVTLTGGEPLAVFNKIISFIKKLSSNGVWVALNSNLTLLTMDIAYKLKNVGLKSILVSLPSAEPSTCDKITGVKNSLELILKGIKNAQTMNFPIFINMVVSKINFNGIKKTAEFVSSIGIRHFSATRASDPASRKEFSQYILNREEFQKMQEELEEVKRIYDLEINSLEANPPCSYGGIVPSQGYKFCNAGKTVCTVSPKGEVRPCNRISKTYGNILKEELKKPWLKMSDWRSDNFIPEECAECKIKYFCNGGCKADVVNTYGDLKKPDPLYDKRYIIKGNINKEVKLTERREFRVNQKIKTRPEKFGAILFSSPKNWLPVTSELLEIILKNLGKDLTIKDVENYLKSSRKDALLTATNLLNKKILL